MRILLIDTESDLIEQALYEANESYIIDSACNEDEGSNLSEINEYDAVIVGPTLSSSKEVLLCRSTRNLNSSVPIAVISNQKGLGKALLLDSGADVCISPPVDGKELGAQIRALIRRNTKNSSSVLKAKNVSLDTTRKIVQVYGQDVFLRRKEYELLEYLLINKNIVVTKEKILEHVWEEGIYSFSNNLEVHIRNLRLALNKYGAEKIIKTVRGFGYIVDA